mmetsp:Transcript_50154/g.76285  ORF Transcript_50154/g.76285 Transcript_50154/m.76285 type:complete len:127 (+) Transcript_50154:353-733(+)
MNNLRGKILQGDQSEAVEFPQDDKKRLFVFEKSKSHIGSSWFSNFTRIFLNSRDHKKISPFREPLKIKLLQEEILVEKILRLCPHKEYLGFAFFFGAKLKTMIEESCKPTVKMSSLLDKLAQFDMR